MREASGGSLAAIGKGAEQPERREIANRLTETTGWRHPL